MSLSRAEIGQWLGTEEASAVHQTLTAIYQFQHANKQPLTDLYGSDIVSDPTFGFASQDELMGRIRGGRNWVPEIDPEKLKQLEDLMPVDQIRNGAYWVQGERLFFSRSGIYLLPKGIDLDEQMKVAGVLEDGNQKYALGIIFRVKSNGLKIFDYLPAGYDNEMTINRTRDIAEALEFRGYTLLFHLRNPAVYKQALL